MRAGRKLRAERRWPRGVALALAGAAAAPARAARPRRLPAGRLRRRRLPQHRPARARTASRARRRRCLPGERHQPPHQYDQNDMYADLVYATPGLQESQILDYFKDASFGVEPGNVTDYTPAAARSAAPTAALRRRDDRPRRVRRPAHLRPGPGGAMFGAGYVTGRGPAVLRRRPAPRGRAPTSPRSPAAPTSGRTTTPSPTPPTCDDRAAAPVRPRRRPLRRRRACRSSTTSTNYVDGMNQCIAETRLDPSKMPGEYAALGHPGGPEPWKVTDVIATGALVAGIFGKGGGDEVGAALVLQEAQQRFGKPRGKQVWKDFRSADDPEAPTTVHDEKFPYRTAAEGEAEGMAMPDPGTVEPSRRSSSRRRGRPADAARRGSSCPTSATCSAPSSEITRRLERAARLGAESETRQPDRRLRPPDRLLRAAAPDGAGRSTRPAGREGPAIDARGVAFVGTNLYVQLGRGRDYSWSATSAGQDIIDTFAVHALQARRRRADAATRRPTLTAASACRWTCSRRPNTWTPERRRHDRRRARETLRVCGQGRARHPPADDQGQALRLHEAPRDLLPRGRLGRSVRRLEQPRGRWRREESWTRPAARTTSPSTGSTSTDEQIAYFNSGANPVRRKGTHPNFPAARQARVAGLHAAVGSTSTAELTSDVDPKREPRSGAGATPAGDRPAYPDELEQQAGARRTALRRDLLLLADLPLRPARRPDRGRDRGQAEDEPGRADQRDGGRRHHRPARRRGRCPGR